MKRRTASYKVGPAHGSRLSTPTRTRYNNWEARAASTRMQLQRASEKRTTHVAPCFSRPLGPLVSHGTTFRKRQYRSTSPNAAKIRHTTRHRVEKPSLLETRGAKMFRHLHPATRRAQGVLSQYIGTRIGVHASRAHILNPYDDEPMHVISYITSETRRSQGASYCLKSTHLYRMKILNRLLDSQTRVFSQQKRKIKPGMQYAWLSALLQSS